MPPDTESYPLAKIEVFIKQLQMTKIDNTILQTTLQKLQKDLLLLKHSKQLQSSQWIVK
jgi:hypothetical protein